MDFDHDMAEWTTSYSDGDEYDDDPFVSPSPYLDDLDQASLTDDEPVPTDEPPA